MNKSENKQDFEARGIMRSAKSENLQPRYPTEQRFWEEYNTGRIVFGDDETTVPRVRTNLFENSKQVMNSVHYSYAQTATVEFINIFDGARVFDNPKPVTDIEKIIRYVCADGDLILDFFSGSGTSAHSSFVASLKSDLKVKFILVQLPEVCDKKSEAYGLGYENIADIAKERIRRAGKKIRTELEAKLDFDDHQNLDLGFKVLKLDKSNFKQWQAPSKDVSEQELIQQMELNVDHVDPNASQEDLLYELLLKAGLMPTERLESIALAGHSLFKVGDDSLYIYLGKNVDQALIDAVLQAKPEQFICLDKAFHGNDQLKANAVKNFAHFNQGKQGFDRIEFKTV